MTMRNPPHLGEFIYDVYLKPAALSCRYPVKQLDAASSSLSQIFKDRPS